MLSLFRLRTVDYLTTLVQMCRCKGVEGVTECTRM